MELFYFLLFYFYIFIHIILLIIFIKVLHKDIILSIILMFLSLYFCCLGFWEIYTTSNVYLLYLLNISTPYTSNYYMLGFYACESFSLYALCFLFYIYHLKQTKEKMKLKLLIFIFLIIGIQLISGLIGDFTFFLLRGLETFNPIEAFWLGWVNNIPLGYVIQLTSGLYFVGLGIFLSYLQKYLIHKNILKT